MPQHYFPGPHPSMPGAAHPSYPPMQAHPPVSASAGASPFQIGASPLFKTAGNEPVAAPPINSSAGMSPFNIAGATPTNAPLTVGDVIHQLPPELVRAGALPAEQPLSLPPTLLENALRSGQAALPVFELYRVCPALFQTPISPQDPRQVALPAAKLPGLIAKAREAQPGGDVAPPSMPGLPASPFGKAPSGPPPPPVTPFQMAAPSEPAGAPAAFPMSPFAAASPNFTAPEQAGAAPAASPFAIKPAAETAAASPFAIKQDVPAATAPSPFALASTLPPPPAAPCASNPPFGALGTPFGAAPGASNSPSSAGAAVPSPFTAAPAASPFAAASAAPMSPPPAPAEPPRASLSSLFTPKSQEMASTPVMTPPSTPASPFASLFAPAASAPAQATAQPPAFAPAAAAPAPAQPPPQPFGQAPAMGGAPSGAASATGMAKLGFAAVLNGYSAEELGFNPVMAPAWISSNIPVSTLNEQLSSGSVTLQLGALIDGISDVGFRNTLASAKRDFQVKLPQNEVFHALTNATAAPASPSAFGSQPPVEAAPRAAAPSSNAFVIQPGGPAGQVNRVEPFSPAPFGAPPMQTFAPQQPAGTHALSAFASQSAPAPAAETPAPAPSSSPLFAPKSGATLNPFAQSQPAKPLAPISTFGSPPPPVMQPTAATAFHPPPTPAEPALQPQQPSPTPSFFSPASEPARHSPPQPLAGAFQPFGSPAPFGQPPPQVTSPQAQTTKPFDPFASLTPPAASPAPSPKPPAESGFSSAQLLGQFAAPEPVSAFAPAPEAKPHAPAPIPETFKPSPSFAPALDELPAAQPAQAPASRGLFSPTPVASTPHVPLFGESAPFKPPAEPKPAAQAQAPASSPGKMAAVKHSFLGLAPLDTQTDQLLLRALLGTEEELSAPRVVELLASQTGLSACVCLHGSHVLSHAHPSKPDAAEFQRQAPDIARQLRGLAPLIGIDGAETFTLNAGGRLLTFCFPGSTTVAVLHDDEPSTGLRDKITLISRELARMLA